MARVCKTLKPKGISGYAHREHKAKKNRTKKNVKQTFDPQKLSPKLKKIEKLLEIDDILKDVVKMADGKKFVKPIKTNPTKKKVRKTKIEIDFKTYPKMRCENCNKEFRLLHDPKKDRIGNKLSNTVCPYCQDYAHFSAYYPVSFWVEYFTIPDYSFLRDLIHAGKIKLSDIL